MNRLTDNDKNWGPFTLARWKNRIAVEIESGDEEDPESSFKIMAFGWALRCQIPKWVIRPYKEKKIATGWDEATIKRIGRNWYYNVYPREYSVVLSNMGNGYDFFQLHFGPQTGDSRTTKSWCKHLPWKGWDCVRHSYYNPDGSHYFTPDQKARFLDYWDHAQKCPSVSFEFDDYDGQRITATCRIEEREWHRGEGWFKWLKWFWPKKIRRSLDIKFSSEVGPEKGSWKGGTTGHGIEIQSGETPQNAFIRYCSLEHRAKGKNFKITFVGLSAAVVA